MNPVILGIPWEEGTYWRKGAKDGPRAVCAEFEKMHVSCAASGGRVPAPLKELDQGMLLLNPYDLTGAFDTISESVGRHLERGEPVIAVGGDHSISYPVLRQFSRHYGAEKLVVLHVDAHSDTFPPIGNFRYHHGAVFRALVEDGYLLASNLMQMGIRGTVREGGLDFVAEHGIVCRSMDDWRFDGLAVDQYKRTDDCVYYLSFDIDAVDPAFAPGTGTPVPGGLTSAEALQVVRAVAATFPLVGADLVEIAPVYDTSGITALLGAHLLFQLLAHGRFMHRPGQGGVA